MVNFTPRNTTLFTWKKVLVKNPIICEKNVVESGTHSDIIRPKTCKTTQLLKS